MERSSPIPLYLMAGFLGGCISAATIMMSGWGVLLALLGYSLGGSAALLLTAVLVYLRNSIGPDHHTTSDWPA